MRSTMKLYSSMIDKALKIAYEAHHGQTDKGGVPYIYHPTSVAEQMDTEDEIITALLHDVVEDTEVTLADLKRAGFSPAVLEAVKLLTHKKGTDYSRYIRKVAKNPLALKVKQADLAHNMSPSRVGNLPQRDAERVREKYGSAIKLLNERIAK